MTRKDYYAKHYNFITHITSTEGISPEELINHFNDLLKALPNGGKLYKYRSGKGESFKYSYNSLKNGYIWMPSSSSLNDKIDTTININADEWVNKVSITAINDPIKIIKLLINKEKRTDEGKRTIVKNDKDADMLLELCDYYNYREQKFNDVESITIIMRYYPEAKTSAKTYLVELNSWINELINIIKQNGESLKISEKALNNDTQKLWKIFSMSESYKIDSMWAYYANDNNGFCIEYDYNKIFEPNNFKKLSLLLSTYKVIYSNKKKVIDTKYITSLMDKKLSEYERLDLALDSFEQLLTKKKCWKQEKEWRLILVQDENIISVDIVSKIIIDETMLNTKNGKKLLRLAKVNKWKIIIRKMNNYGNDHIYKCL